MSACWRLLKQTKKLDFAKLFDLNCEDAVGNKSYLSRKLILENVKVEQQYIKQGLNNENISLKFEIRISEGSFKNVRIMVL